VNSVSCDGDLTVNGALTLYADSSVTGAFDAANYLEVQANAALTLSSAGTVGSLVVLDGGAALGRKRATENCSLQFTVAPFPGRCLMCGRTSPTPVFKMANVEPIAYFDQCSLEESLILSIRLDVGARTLDMVVDYPAEILSRAFHALEEGREVPNEPRDFRRLLFREVSGLTCKEKSVDESLELPCFRKVKIHTNTHATISSVSVVRDRGMYKYILKTDLYWPIRFTFQELEVARRRGIALQQFHRNEMMYRDVESGEVFRFSEPFPPT
jgi:hypothetical protein